LASRLAGDRSSLGRCQPQPGGLETPQQHPALHDLGTQSDQFVAKILRDVVVISLESAPRYPGRLGKRMQLIQRVVADEMTPSATAVPPPGFIHQNRHSRHTTTRHWHTGHMSGYDLELRIAWQSHVRWFSDPMFGPISAAWFDSVLARHREPHRHYHGPRHVQWVVRHVLDLAATRDTEVSPIVAAAFFHDVIYDPFRNDNEARSADLARQSLVELEWRAPTVDRVAAMICATAHHESEDLGTSVLSAADLAVLAASPSKYGDYSRAVRREYQHVDDHEWSVGRTAVLSGFLDRDHIFGPRLELDDWERQARANITAELASLAV